MKEEVVLTTVMGGLSFLSIVLQATVLYGICQVTLITLIVFSLIDKSDQVYRRGRRQHIRCNLTIIFLTINSTAQLLYLVLVAPAEMVFMVTQQWYFGSLLCKLFKSWKSACSGNNTCLLEMVPDQIKEKISF